MRIILIYLASSMIVGALKLWAERDAVMTVIARSVPPERLTRTRVAAYVAGGILISPVMVPVAAVYGLLRRWHGVLVIARSTLQHMVNRSMIDHEFRLRSQPALCPAPVHARVVLVVVAHDGTHTASVHPVQALRTCVVNVYRQSTGLRTFPAVAPHHSELVRLGWTFHYNEFKTEALVVDGEDGLVSMSEFGDYPNSVAFYTDGTLDVAALADDFATEIKGRGEDSSRPDRDAALITQSEEA